MFIAAHHPLSPSLAIAGCGIAAVVCIALPNAWLVLLPALLPLVDLAPWTGWLTFEEFDILVLGAAAGAWMRRAWFSGPGQGSRSSITLLALTGLFLIAMAIALVRGIQDAGGFQFGWFQGYDGPMNSLRLAKSFILAALFAPLLAQTLSRRDSRSSALLAWGMAIGLTTASLAAIWERIAFPGLLNFSADYRTTALFWEMHVGGAAFDGFLALTMPFAVLLLLRAHGFGQIVPAAVILALGIYASLTTFSRGVYLAEVVSLGVMALVIIAGTSIAMKESAKPGRLVIVLGVTALLWAVAAIGVSYLVFRNGGYRTLAATVGTFAVLLVSAPIARAASVRAWAIAFATTVLLSATALVAAAFIGKGVYWAYAAIFASALAGTYSHLRSNRPAAGLVLGATLALPVATVQVAEHWGGAAAFRDSIVALVFLVALAVWNIRSARPWWPTELRKQTATLVGVFTLAAVAAVFSGGAYIEDRFSTSEHDLAGRTRHWRDALELLRSPNDWLLGKGLGRFPASFFFGAPGNEFPGTYRVSQDGNNALLSLSGPHYQIGYGEVLRISQRIRLGPPGQYHVEFDARAPRKVIMSMGMCTKHLLYAEACIDKEIHLEPADANWQHLAFELDGRQIGGAPWYAPQLAVFSVALQTTGGRVDLDNLKVTNPLGESLLANGDFSADMARWFFTSDHHHMPWHMKNMSMHLLFEQGIVGLVSVVLLVLVALARSLTGRRAHHPLAPAIVAAVVGFLVVGLFDSLLDVPRVAFLFFLLLLIGIQGRRKVQ
jgi:hypothetical protein